MGKADPVAPNTKPDGSDNPDGRRLNRRVTISFGQ
jgi:outer membrane protein OmpA-like peptidoglycan-associated protein